MNKKEFASIASNGLVKQNPVFRLILGTCPTLAISTAVSNGLGMGMAVTFVLIFSNLIVSLLRSVIPDKVRIPAYIMVIATFVTVTDLAVAKYLPTLYDALGVYLPLITVNCIILSRADSYAASHKPLYAVADGLFMGLGYTLSLTLICIVREVLGSGSFFGIELWDFNVGFFQKSAGAFFTYGMLLILVNYLVDKFETSKRKKEYTAKYGNLKFAPEAQKEAE